MVQMEVVDPIALRNIPFKIDHHIRNNHREKNVPLEISLAIQSVDQMGNEPKVMITVIFT